MLVNGKAAIESAPEAWRIRHHFSVMIFLRGTGVYQEIKLKNNIVFSDLSGMMPG